MNQFEYESQGATTFLVYKKGEGDVIDSISMGMISNNMIEGVLPFVFMQMDDSIYFKYNVSAKNTLEQFFSGVVSKKNLLSVLSSILDTFIISEEYMLESSAFILDPSYIFINPQNSKASLVALPIVRESDISLEQFVRQLIFGIRPDQTEDCSYIATLISFLNSNQFFSIHDFRKLIGDLQIKGNAQPPRSMEVPVQQPISNMKKESAFSNVEKVIPESSYATPKSDHMGTSLLSEVDIPKPDVVKADVQKERWSPIPEDKPEKKGFFARRKEKEEQKKAEKEQKKLEKKAGKEKKSLFGKSSEKKSAGTGFSGFEIPGMESNMPFGRSDEYAAARGMQEQGETRKMERSGVPEQNIEMQRYQNQRQDFGGTVDLRSFSEGTTVLSGTTVLVQNQVQPSLLNLRTKEKYQLAKETVKVGKDPMSNDLCVQGNPAVSREHACFSVRGGEVYIIDRRSTNGTFVDGVRTQPDVAFGPLKHGMRVRFADEEFEFREHE